MGPGGGGALPPEIRVYWAVPPVGAEEAEAARAAVAATFLSMGRNARAFEAAMAAYAGRAHAIGVSNGTDALELAMRLVGLGPGDEVVVSSLSYIATVNCIVRVGAVPVFADVEPGTLNIDPDHAATLISPRTRALLVADYCGYALPYDRLVPLAEAKGIDLVVDGAQSIGTFFGERPALAFGRVSTTSFHAAKIMTTGEGGMVFLDDDGLEALARRVRGQGEIPGRKYVHDTLGFNHRITDVQAAIGLVQLGKLEALSAARRRVAHRYQDRLRGVDGVGLLAPLPGTTPAWFSFPVLLDERDRVAAGLRAAGVETRSLYPIPTYRQPIAEYPPLPAEARPAAEWASARVLNLPLHHAMSDALVDEVSDLVVDLLSG